MGDHEALHESWRVIIEDLETDLARLQSAPHVPMDEPMLSARWSPPAVAGPLPDEYAIHVRDLIARQRDAVTRLEEARRVTGEHLSAVRAAASSTGEAVYLDVEG
ncbi:MAG: hypothetical protein JWP19_34 [Rhodoglobus sp.]|nr:hypothetical protein [Rhodoglobus sp.]